MRRWDRATRRTAATRLPRAKPGEDWCAAGTEGDEPRHHRPRGLGVDDASRRQRLAVTWRLLLPAWLVAGILLGPGLDLWPAQFESWSAAAEPGGKPTPRKSSDVSWSWKSIPAPTA